MCFRGFFEKEGEMVSAGDYFKILMASVMVFS